MEAFHWIVIGVALFFLILILVFVGLMMRTNMSNNNIFPPVQQTCPDLWVNDSSGNCYYVGNNGGSGLTGTNSTPNKYSGDASFPIYVYNNVHDNGTSGWTNSSNQSTSAPSYVPSTLPSNLTGSSNYAVFKTSDTAWSNKGSIPLCQQKKFANNNNIYWDGVSNTNQC
jgi:hypothetical protein